MSYVGNIQVYTNEWCNLGVEDITPGLDPSFSAMAMFYTDDSWGTNSCDFSNPSNHYWNVAAVNGTLYSFVVFHVRTWDISQPTSVPDTVMVYYSGQFYMNISGAPVQMNDPLIPLPGSDVSVWQLLDCTSYADFVTAAAITDLVQMTGYADGEVECPYFTVRQTDTCYVWEVCDVSGLGEEITVTVYEYGSTTALSTYTLTAGGCVEITLPEDGVFVVGFSYIDDASGSEEIVDLEFHLVYETCTIKTCYNSLVVDILCQTWDTCCTDPCTEAERLILQNKRDTLNQMVALVGYLVAAIWVEHTKFTNILTEYQGSADETRDAYVVRVQQTIDRLAEIVGRCGICSTTTDTTTTGCANCS